MNFNSNVIDKEGYETLKIIGKADQFNLWMYNSIHKYLYGQILEIGSGIGNISKYFINSGATISLSDINKTYLELLSEKYKSHPNVQSILSIDLNKVEFKTIYAAHEQKYDSIYLLNVLEHIADDGLAIENCRFLLKPNGTILILVPAYSFLFSNIDKYLGHYRRYTAKDLTALLSSKEFSIKKSFYFNALGIIAWTYGKLLRLKNIPNKEMTLFNRVTFIARLIDTLCLKKFGLSVIIVATKKTSSIKKC